MAAAGALISTIARAFYDDDVVCLFDVLLRERYLRDDDMHVRLSLPAKQLRRTLQFLEEEQLVKHELVDDLARVEVRILSFGTLSELVISFVGWLVAFHTVLFPLLINTTYNIVSSYLLHHTTSATTMQYTLFVWNTSLAKETIHR